MLRFKMCSLCSTLQWQNANAKVSQLAEGTDEVQFFLDGRRTICDQLEARPDEDDTEKKKSIKLHGQI